MSTLACENSCPSSPPASSRPEWRFLLAKRYSGRERRRTAVYAGYVHTNPFSNENGAVLIRFQNNLRPYLSFSYRFPRPHYNAVSILKTLLYPQCACSNELDACAFQYIGPRNWREIEGTWWRPSAILDTHGRVVCRPVVSSPFSDSIVFSVHTTKQRFRMAPFSVIVFCVVEWTIAAFGAKQLRFRLKTDWCGRGLSRSAPRYIEIGNL